MSKLKEIKVKFIFFTRHTILDLKFAMNLYKITTILILTTKTQGQENLRRIVFLASVLELGLCIYQC